MIQNAKIFFFFLYIFIVVGFVFLYILDMDSMNEENEENNEYGDTVSSAPKRMRCRTSSVLSDFETMLSFETVRAYGKKKTTL